VVSYALRIDESQLEPDRCAHEKPDRGAHEKPDRGAHEKPDE
jgi:hypothetical protein